MNTFTSSSQTFGLSPQQAFLLTSGGSMPLVSQCALALSPETSAQQLQARLNECVARHEALRTTFPIPPGVRAPVAQAIHEDSPPVWVQSSLGPAPGDLADLCAAEAGRLDLERGPSLRAVLATSDENRILVLTAPAACADPRSLLALARELEAGLPAGAQDPVQHADYAAWRQELVHSAEPEALQGREFWATVGDDLEVAPGLPGRLLGDAPAQAPDVIEVVLSEVERNELTVSAAQTRLPSATLVQAAWLALLARVTGAGDLLTVHVGDGRALEDLADAVGPYAQPLPVRVAVAPQTRFRELLDRLARAVAQATGWQDYASEHELARVAAQALAAFSAVDLSGQERVHHLTAPASGCSLQLHWQAPGRAQLLFDPGRHARADVEDLARGLRALLRAAVADPSLALGELPITDAQMREELLALADGGSQAPGLAVHVAFAQHAAQAPHRPAVVAGGAQLSYGELDDRAQNVARALLALGVRSDEPVGLCLSRSPGLLAGLLGILKAGGAYLPLNPGHPPARMGHQLREAGARVLLTERVLADRFTDAGVTHVLCLEDLAVQGDGGPARPAADGELAYVMYTSGSTGTPKGVAVTHANLAAYTAAICARIEVQEGLHFATVSDLSTDLGNSAIFPALASGGCVHLIDTETAMDGQALADYVRTHPLDVMKITPTHLRALLEASDGFLPRRWLIVGGEALSWDLARRAAAAAPGCRVLNHYGPTETTIGCCTFEVTGPSPSAGATVPIGRPLPGARAYVLDGKLAPVPFGVVGELCVGGAGVARGYVNRPVETAERFVTDPRGGRMYRTGDRVRLARDGAIEFLGRIDHQVKIRGFRVEPGEVESALLRHPAVTGAAVVAVQDAGAEPRLVAYFVASGEPDHRELEAFAAESLPDYMIPARWVPIAALPLTASGKVDRLALPDPDSVEVRRTGQFIPPRDDLEREIAAIWSELLGVQEVGVLDDFFALGGHSLLATQAIMRIRRIHGNIPLGALFNSPTVSALAEVIRQRSDTPAADR